MYKINKNAKDKCRKINNFILPTERVKDMIKKMAWNTFKNTGDINTFLELIEVENIEKNMLEAKKQDGNIKGEGTSNIRT